MQQMMLHNKVYQMGRIDEAEYSPEVYERLEKINLFKKMRSERCSIDTACAALKVAKSTFYRWRKRYKLHGLAGLEDESRRPNVIRQTSWDRKLTQKVLHLRKQNPLYGKAKIAVLLKRDHRIVTSVSTVGRIITYLIKRNQIKSASFYYAKKRVSPRLFNNHAQRWRKNMKAKRPGEMFQIDHMSRFYSSWIPRKTFPRHLPYYQDGYRTGIFTCQQQHC